jgi:hypothetical protein
MSIDIKKLEEYLIQKNYEEAGKMIQTMVKEKLSAEEKGDVMVGIISAYIEISNMIDERYLEALDDAIESLKKLNKAETKIKESIKIKELNDRLDQTS